MISRFPLLVVLVSLCKDLLQLALSGITNSSTTPPLGLRFIVIFRAKCCKLSHTFS